MVLQWTVGIEQQITMATGIILQVLILGKMVAMGQIAEDDMNVVNVTFHMAKLLLTIDTREIAV